MSIVHLVAGLMVLAIFFALYAACYLARRKRSKAKGMALLCAFLLAVAGTVMVLADDDCWPEPEPIPADCKPGQPCPVDEPAGTTGGEVKTPASGSTSMTSTGVNRGAVNTSAEETSASGANTTGLDDGSSAPTAADPLSSSTSPVGGNG